MSTHPRHRAGLIAAAAGVIAVAMTDAQLWALKGAGLHVAEPPGGAAIARLFSTLQANWEWFIFIAAGLVLAFAFGMMAFGSQRAPDRIFTVGGGLLGLLFIPTILH